MATAYNEYLMTPVAGVLTPWVNVWVRLVSNNTGTAYVSDAVTDSKGRFTFAAKPPGDSYTVYTGPTNVGAWTSTGDVAYSVPYVAGDDIVGHSFTGSSSSPYAPAAGIVPGENVTALNPHNVKAYGAKGDGRNINPASATSNGTMNGTTGVLTSASNPWTSLDVGKLIRVPGAGAAGAALVTTIASFQSAGQVTLTANSATAVTTANPCWGTDDSVAILAAVNAAAATVANSYSNRGAVFFPAGIFCIGSGAYAPLTETNTTTLHAGIHYFGLGKYISILRLFAGGSDLYFYDNVATPRMQHNTFANLGFEGYDPVIFTAYTDIPTTAKGFRLWATAATGSHDQAFKWNSCRLFGMGSMFETAGDNTASECGFVQCDFNQARTQFCVLNNLQSYDHEFVNCDWVDIWGDMWVLGPNDGGAVKVIGGSSIMQSQTATDTYFIKQVAGPVTGPAGDPILFLGHKMELLGNFTNLVNVGAIGYNWFKFDNCGIHVTSTVQKAAWCTIQQQVVVNFFRCTFLEGTANTMQFICAGNTTLYGMDGEIGFDSCTVPLDWSDRCSITNVGSIWALNCWTTAVGSQSAGIHYAHDFDLRTGTALGQVGVWLGDGTVKDSASVSHPQWRLKTAVLKTEAEQWGVPAGYPEHTLKLPKGAYIKAIHLRKPIRGADATVVGLLVTNSGKTVTHLATTPLAFGPNAHSGDVDNYFYCVGDTVGERTIRLYGTAVPTQVTFGGIAIVEYY